MRAEQILEALQVADRPLRRFIELSDEELERVSNAFEATPDAMNVLGRRRVVELSDRLRCCLVGSF